MEYFNDVVGSSNAAQVIRYIGYGLAVSVAMVIGSLLSLRAINNLIGGKEKVESAFFNAGLTGFWIIAVVTFFSFV